jgi:acetyl-CoA carboxylase carboxyl transferase subunit beta
MMALFGKPKYSTVFTGRRKDIPADIFVRCPISGEAVYRRELEENWNVVPKSGYHFPLTAPERVRSLLDPDSFVEMDRELSTGDPLQFTVGNVNYADKLRENQKKTGMDEAVIAGMGKIEGRVISFAAMDFRFLGASMGSVVGERITRTIERGASRGVPVVIICTSGGARMYEGILSLMQMAKISAALAELAAERRPYIAVLTHPTMAGIIASFASLGDVILAEPGALIGFAGPLVIRETTRQELPADFQKAEFLLGRGFLDQIVHRHQLRSRISRFLRFFCANGRKENSCL